MPLALNAILVTSNLREFEHVPGLSRENRGDSATPLSHAHNLVSMRR